MELNGGSVIAMNSKECVAIACDLRLGNQALTVATNFEKVCRRTSDLTWILTKIPDIPRHRSNLPGPSWTRYRCSNTVSTAVTFALRQSLRINLDERSFASA